ncbi:uracil-DNA glycosylase family protein [Roseiterribacter gracilis]|uniref:Uracil-DNA glycosylase n=1 Tax=Roseiterribacter gracilis TaxID=2812848 RepID=A0A8S8X7Y6_9PROT|nr:uracil-DNA glycosylase [Rhodospirillales bacterium TMPK1]
MECKPNCGRCRRLVRYRDANRARYPDWHNGPVLAEGPLHAPLLLVGLAPGLKGANRTGRPFVGDASGDLVQAALATRPEPAIRITNAALCAPPQNAPTPAELAKCRPFLAAELARPSVRAIFAIGAVAHAQVLRALGSSGRAHTFAHGAVHQLDDGRMLIDSYHCSRLNVSTGRITAAMFEAALDLARRAACV